MKLPIIIMGFIAMISCKTETYKDQPAEELSVTSDAEIEHIPVIPIDQAELENEKLALYLEQVPQIALDSFESEIDPYQMEEEAIDQLITVEAEAASSDQRIRIIEIISSNNRLYIISEVTNNVTDEIPMAALIFDSVSINSKPADIEYIIIGEKPSKMISKPFRYVSNLSNWKSTIPNPVIVFSIS